MDKSGLLKLAEIEEAIAALYMTKIPNGTHLQYSLEWTLLNDVETFKRRAAALRARNVCALRRQTTSASYRVPIRSAICGWPREGRASLAIERNSKQWEWNPKERNDK